MATLAVFIALGGSAYAVSRINGNRLVNGSVAGKKLKRNTITGRQVKESRLGTVRSASHAASATSASTANKANTARTSATATTADNALAFAGLAPSAFERPDRVLYGTARADATAPQLLFSSTVAGFDLTTDGDADSSPQIRIANTGTTDNLIGRPFTSAGPGTAFSIAPGTSGEVGPSSGGSGDYLNTVVAQANHTAKAVSVGCYFNSANGAPTVLCWGVQASTP